MKKNLILSTLLVLICSMLMPAVYAQSPDKMSYQAVIRDNQNALKSNAAVGMQTSILKGSENGTVVYAERHFPMTNANGLVSIEIGDGTVIIGNFSAIDWSQGPYFIKTETDLNGGINYNISGTSQLLSVPYALYAGKAGNEFSGDYNDLTHKPDFTKWDKDSTDNVTLSGNQVISGNKLFTGITTVPTPVNGTDAATKAYVDLLQERIEALEIMVGFTDARDGNHYKMVKIGNQIWMAENLRYLPSVVPATTGSQAAPYNYVYGYDGTDVNAAKAHINYNTYGVLYNWNSAMAGSASSSTNPSGVQGVCPDGWHMPSDAEWMQMISLLGGSAVAGGKLKEMGTAHWKTPNTGASNKSNFTALPGGDRRDEAKFDGIGSSGSWWSSTQTNDLGANSQNLYYNEEAIHKFNVYKQRGLSIRCVKDE